MQKIRAEKEFIVRWSGILTNGKPDSLEGRDLALYLISPYGAESRQEMAVEGNTVTFRVYADTCKAYGQYRLKLYENKGKAGQTVLDQCEGFCVVATTCQEGGITEGLDLDTVELSGGDICVGVQGPQGPSGNINYPTFSVDDNMHLIMRADAASDKDRFKVDSDGHLILTI